MEKESSYNLQKRKYFAMLFHIFKTRTQLRLVHVHGHFQRYFNYIVALILEEIAQAN